MGTGYHGGFGLTEGSKEYRPKTVLPENEAQLKHIFSGKKGHFKDTPANRKLLENLANDRSKFIGIDKYGNHWNARINNNGSQDWVRYRRNIINEGGRNNIPREWDDETGFNNNPFKGRNNK